MKQYKDFVAEVLPHIRELFPWDAETLLEERGDEVLVVDTREPYEFDAMHIERSINVPRGILEAACDWGYEETVPELVEARERPVLLVCRSGNRSALAAYTLQLMGYREVYSLKTGLRGWNDYELPLVDKDGLQVDADTAEAYFYTGPRPDQLPPSAQS